MPVIFPLSTVTRRHSIQIPWTYADLDAYQRRIQQKILNDETYHGEVIFSEVQSVVTAGRRSSLIGEPGTFTVDRGGLETWHGPGQCVIFPVVRMKEVFGGERALKRAILSLLEVSLEAVSTFRPHARIELGDRLGIWTERGKLVSIGVAIKQGVLLHGVAINLHPSADSFSGINPCGIPGAQADFCVGDENPEIFNFLREYWVRAFQAQLGLLGSRLEQASESLVLRNDLRPRVLSSTSF